ncbi:unnamed protein product [Miscanthus lutarioriparius]|uniref:Uncharacterized protein n=1 Tax=Miscanthus lutarioriparius TaxID=422564 RepID=A0A811RGK1_9POAL|nr:unnamed protein product [Miscanthus lutarioriparius]
MARKCFGDGRSGSSGLFLLGAGPARWRFSGGRGGGGAPPSPTATNSALLGAIGRTRTLPRSLVDLSLLLCSLAPPQVLAAAAASEGTEEQKPIRSTCLKWRSYFCRFTIFVFFGDSLKEY